MIQEDGIYVPVNLDITKALTDFAKLQKTVTETRPNKDLEDFFNGIAEPVKNAREELKKFAVDMAALGRSSAAAPFAMNMSGGAGGLGSASYRSFSPMSRGRAWSNDYLSMQGREDASRKSSYENRFQNRYLASEIADGSYKKKAQDMIAAERAAAALQRRQDQLLSQGRLIQRQARYGTIGGSLAHLYGENANQINGAAGLIGGAGKYAGLAAAGAAASGFSGTVEGEQFARELRLLSLEMAASFKPLVDTLTRGTRSLRHQFEQLSPAGQDRIQTFGLAAGGAYLGSRFGPYGAAVGAAVGGTVGEVISRGTSRDRGMNRAALENKDLNQLDGQERLDEIKKRRDEATGGFGIFAVAQKRWFGKNGEADELAGQLRAFDEAKRQTQMEMRIRSKEGRGEMLTKEEEDFKSGKSLDSKANPDRRQLMITEGTGFAAAGSTFFALQEDLMRTYATEANTQTKILQSIDDSLKSLNR